MFCCLWVVLHHLNLGQYTSNTLMIFFDRYFLHTSRTAAAFFFLLSGFMIDYSMKNTASWRTFFIRRFSRVYPNHWLVSLTIGSFALIIPVILGENLRWHFYKLSLYFPLLQAFYPSREVNFAFNGVTWTLSCEVFFYFLFIFLRRATIKQLSYLFLTLFCMKFALEGWFVISNTAHLAHWLFFVFPVFRLPDFVLGMILCRIYLVKPKVFSFFKVHPFWVLLSTILIIGVYRYTFSCDAIFLYSTVPLICSVFLLTSCLGSHLNEKNRLSNKAIVHIGEATFSIYLVHQPVMNGARKIFQALGLQITLEYMFFVGLISLLVSYVYFAFIEKRAYQFSVQILTRIFKPRDIPKINP